MGVDLGVYRTRTGIFVANRNEVWQGNTKKSMNLTFTLSGVCK
jgi:hypothetical protein